MELVVSVQILRLSQGEGKERFTGRGKEISRKAGRKKDSMKEERRIP